MNNQRFFKALAVLSGLLIISTGINLFQRFTNGLLLSPGKIIRSETMMLILFTVLLISVMLLITSLVESIKTKKL